MATPRPTPNDFLVVPGHSLGHLQLGDNANTLSTLGKGAYGDAAMQKAWGTWYGRRPANGMAPSELDVYTAPQNNDVDHHTVQVIRATSPWFHLANGLRPGSSLEAIRVAYGKLPLVATFRMADGPHHLYDDMAHGIAFETDTTAGFGCCQALIVHQAGKLLMQNYLPMPEYLKQVPSAR
ncbi:hypothetical protein A8B98_24300 [Hymenobacter sp. UV11]|nr:hypothetical protein A8B98_24300 [Hymenobacter sp. UV11]